jgi:hypothetical protein
MNSAQMAPIRFREEQAFRQCWIVLLMGFLVALQWWGFIQQIVLGIPWGNRPAPDWMMVLLWLAFGIGLPAFFLYLRLIVTVTDQSIVIHYRPILKHVIPISEVERHRVRNYSSLRDYGGWGIRGLPSNRAYNVSGDRGVELLLTGGRRVLIGSQRADELARAIIGEPEPRRGFP